MLTEHACLRLSRKVVSAETIDLPTVVRGHMSQQPGGREMIVMFSARRLKPGAWEQFRQAWDPGESRPPGFQRAFHARNIRDEDEIISFGLFEMTEDEYHRWREEAEAQENQRVDHLSAFVENDHVSGVYQVIDTLDG
jgi:heme-degrading monooxygenase HmoA